MTGVLLFLPGRNRNSHRADGPIQSRTDDGAELQAVAPHFEMVSFLTRRLFRAGLFTPSKTERRHKAELQ